MLGRLFRQFAFLLLVSASLVWAVRVDLTTRKSPTGDLGIALDFDFALQLGPFDIDEKNQRVRDTVLSSHLVFENEVTGLTDGQIVQMTMDAYNEMKPEREQYGLTSKSSEPRVMAALVFENEIIFASSHKGPAFTTDFAVPQVKELLRRCQAAFMEKPENERLSDEHKNRASCGEIMAAQIYFRIYPERQLEDLKGRVVAVAGRNKVADAVVAPCPDGAIGWWGCQEFTELAGLEVISTGQTGEPYKEDLERLGKMTKEVVSVIGCQKVKP